MTNPVVKYMDLQEFVDEGFLQEANRQFFHPLGLALEVDTSGDGPPTLSGVWDYRDDPEGVMFGPGVISREKYDRVLREFKSHVQARADLLGSTYQSVSDLGGQE